MTVYDKKNHKISKFIAAILMVCMVLAGCSGSRTSSEEHTGQAVARTESSGSAATLQAMNELPEDGIITKEELETVAGTDQQVAFHGTDASGIEYTWTFDCSQIQNPVDQNLKIDFQLEDLDEIKSQANNANDALMMTMHGKGLVCVPTLEVLIPESWQSDTVLLLKEQDGKLAKMSEVSLESSEEEGSTLFTMTVTTLDGACYLVGGITNVQNAGADAANGQDVASADTDAESNLSDGDGSSDSASGSDADGDSSSDSSKSSSSKSNQSGKDVANDASSDTAHYCTISISCATILNNMDNLADGKEEFVPSNGWILKASQVEFTEGESVHDVLKRVCKDAGIHMESSYTPAYDSAYVEGINQLYEFDCGELSGWMYNVNGWFPNYGCSKYTVEDGDVINWVYTCDLGKDVGDNSMY